MCDECVEKYVLYSTVVEKQKTKEIYIVDSWYIYIQRNTKASKRTERDQKSVQEKVYVYVSVCALCAALIVTALTVCINFLLTAFS